MADDLRFQLRLTLNDEFAQVARNDLADPSIATLTDVLNRHDTVMKCQFDAFADYVREAEASGIENFPLYEWTKKTIDEPAKKAKYTKSFALYVGGDEVYEKDKADAARTSPHVHQREREVSPAAALHRLVDPKHGEWLEQACVLQRARINCLENRACPRAPLPSASCRHRRRRPA
jgi:hypothetical protein